MANSAALKKLERGCDPTTGQRLATLPRRLTSGDVGLSHVPKVIHGITDWGTHASTDNCEYPAGITNEVAFPFDITSTDGSDSEIHRLRAEDLLGCV